MPKTIRTLNKSAPRWKPYPWSRFNNDDLPREKPLSRCPDAKCRRAKTCVAAHQGLYCQRTHFARAEGRKRRLQSEMDLHIASIDMPPEGAGLDIRLAYVKEIAGLKKAEHQHMMRVWRAGGYGETYGPYRAGGVMKSPPVRDYEEE